MVLNLHGPLLRVYGCLSIETRLSGVCVPPACVPRRGSGQVSFSLSYVYIFDSPFSCTPQRCKDNAGTTTVCGIHSVGFVSFNSNIPRNSSSGICPWRRNWNSSDKKFLFVRSASLSQIRITQRGERRRRRRGEGDTDRQATTSDCVTCYIIPSDLREPLFLFYGLFRPYHHFCKIGLCVCVWFSSSLLLPNLLRTTDGCLYNVWRVIQSRPSSFFFLLSLLSWVAVAVPCFFFYSVVNVTAGQNFRSSRRSYTLNSLFRSN